MEFGSSHVYVHSKPKTSRPSTSDAESLVIRENIPVSTDEPTDNLSLNLSSSEASVYTVDEKVEVKPDSVVPSSLLNDYYSEEPKPKPASSRLKDIHPPKCSSASPLCENQIDSGFSKCLESNDLTVKNLVKATKKVKEWKPFGHLLGMKREVLKNIDELEAPPEMKKAQMFDQWLETDPDASWQLFSTALDDAGYSELPTSTGAKGSTDETPSLGTLKLSILSESDLPMLLNLLNDVRSNWYDIGLQLPGITRGDLDAIKEDRGTNSRICLRELMILWLRNGEATREALAVALESPVVRAKDLANVLLHRVRKMKSAPKFGSSSHWERKQDSDSSDNEDFGAAQPSFEIDTNVIEISLGVLADSPCVCSGDPVICSNDECKAILNSNSSLAEEGVEDQKQVWHCEFCGTKNCLNILTEEIPKVNDTCYLLEPNKDYSDVNPEENDGIIVFCLDTSGSMAVTKKVPGIFDLVGQKRTKKLFRAYSEADVQFPREHGNFTHVSRLHCIQGAVMKQLSTMLAVKPSRRVGLVTFNNEVVIFCGNKAEEVTVAGEKLCDRNALEQIGYSLKKPYMIMTVKESFETHIKSLEESGQTALGPALLLSIMIAGRVRGSKVILCTDGLANVGVGSLDEPKNDEVKRSNVLSFYSSLGTMARDKSVSVSIVTIKDSVSDLICLSRVADLSGGKVDIVDPLAVKDNFSYIMSTKVLATDVTTTILLHRQLQFTVGDQKSRLVVPVGNATKDIRLSYSFAIVKRSSSNSGSGTGAVNDVNTSVSIDESKNLPFQVQMKYLGLDGSQYVRVITKTLPSTTEFKLAAKGANMTTLGPHLVDQVADFVKQGNIEEALEYSRASIGSVLPAIHKSSIDPHAVDTTADELRQASSSIIKFERSRAKPGMALSLTADREFLSITSSAGRLGSRLKKSTPHQFEQSQAIHSVSGTIHKSTDDSNETTVEATQDEVPEQPSNVSKTASCLIS